MAVIQLANMAEVQAGIYVGYLLDASITSEGDLGQYSDDISTDNLKSFDFGLVGDAALMFNMLRIGARYNLGMVILDDSKCADFFIGRRQKSIGPDIYSNSYERMNYKNQINL